MEKTVRCITLFLLGLFLIISTFCVGIQSFSDLQKPIEKLEKYGKYSQIVFSIVGIITLWYRIYPEMLQIFFLDNKLFWKSKEKRDKLKENLKDNKNDYPLFLLTVSSAVIFFICFLFVFVKYFEALKESPRIFLMYCLTVCVSSVLFLSGIFFLVYYTQYYRKQVLKIEKPWLLKPQEFLR